MDLFYKALNLGCAGFAVVLTIFAAIKFRKEHLFKPVILGISALLSLILLPVYIAISGIHLNFLLGFLVFALGIGLGLFSGGTAKLKRVPPGVVGKQSWLAFAIWAFSLVFSMLMNLFASALTSALGVLPLCFTTGIQVSANILLAFRTRKVRGTNPAA